MVSQHIINAQTKFESWRSALAERLDHADANLKAWLAIEGYRQEHVAELNIAPAFWSLTMRAHLHAGLLDLATLVDRNRQSISIYRLLDYVEEYQELFSDRAYENRLRTQSIHGKRLEEMVRDRRRVTEEKICEDRTAIADFDKDIKNLRGGRNKVLAHVDEEFLRKGKSVDQVYPLLRTRTFAALTTFGDIFNFYSDAYDSSTYDIGVPFESSLQTMISALTQWHQARRDSRIG